MRYVNDYFYEKSQLKLQKYFAILLHTKRIFFIMSDILNNMKFLYMNFEEKKE